MNKPKLVAPKPRETHRQLASVWLGLLVVAAGAIFAVAYDSRYGGWWVACIVGACALAALTAFLILHLVWEHGHHHGLSAQKPGT